MTSPITIFDEIAEYKRRTKKAPIPPMINTIIDLSHHNNCDLPTIQNAGIVAIVHKASQGAAFIDPQYAARKQQALAMGFLWGSYHFGTGVDVMDQVSNFLRSVGTLAPNELLALDFEPNPGGMSMTLDQAHQFVTLIQNELGFWPMIYGGYTIRASIGTNPDPILANCPLWYARYAAAPYGIPHQVWPSYTLWQYSDLGTVDGVGPCDRNWYQGTTDDLTAAWPFH
jgi:lysozyme